MDKALTTILLVIASLVTVVMVMNAVYPATSQSSSALSSISTRMGDRMKTQTAIVHATGELDQDGVWQDTNSDGEFDLFIWVKNIGSTRITNIENSDIFIGSQGDWTRILYKDWTGGALPSWDYVVENGTEWIQTNTIMIEVSCNSTLQSGEYHVKIIIPNGVSDEYDFSM
jgi:archaellum component FlaG (FlaF/FlaG flagellin family)